MDFPKKIVVVLLGLRTKDQIGRSSEGLLTGERR